MGQIAENALWREDDGVIAELVCERDSGESKYEFVHLIADGSRG